jgi:hypothetical protein
MRLFFVYRGRNTPSGGHKQVRLLCTLLNALGAEASLLSDGLAEDGHLYGDEAPLAPFSFASARPHLRPDDVVILPETRVEEYCEVMAKWSCRRAVNNQNGFYAIECRPRGGYARHGIEFALANTPFVGTVTHRVLGLDPSRIFVVPHWVVRSPFRYNGDQHSDRRLAVCYMPRKLADHVRSIRALVGRVEPGVPWVEIDGLSETEVAKRFQDNAILLSTQDREGCPLPALEAMACGCIVAGYRGLGPFPHPYATPMNGLWARDRAAAAAATQVVRAIRIARAGGRVLECLRESGFETSRAYARPAVEYALRHMLKIVEMSAYNENSPGLPPLGWFDLCAVRRLRAGRHFNSWRDSLKNWATRWHDRLAGGRQNSKSLAE